MGVKPIFFPVGLGSVRLDCGYLPLHQDLSSVIDLHKYWSHFVMILASPCQEKIFLFIWYRGSKNLVGILFNIYIYVIYIIFFFSFHRRRYKDLGY